MVQILYYNHHYYQLFQQQAGRINHKLNSITDGKTNYVEICAFIYIVTKENGLHGTNTNHSFTQIESKIRLITKRPLILYQNEKEEKKSFEFEDIDEMLLYNYSFVNVVSSSNLQKYCS